MIRNYFKIAWRNLLKNKTFSLINIFGLSVGMATCLVLLLYIFDELKYDKHHKDLDRLYRIAMDANGEKWAGTSAPFSAGMKKDFPEIEQTTRFLKFPNIDKMLLKNEKNKKQFYETNGYYVDSTFFDVFSYEFKYGNPQIALNQPNTIVLSENVAYKLFGNVDPIDKIINIEIPYGKLNYTVKGVFKNNDSKSHIDANYFISMRNDDIGQWVANQTNWSNNSIFHTYFKLKKETNLATFKSKLPQFLNRYMGEEIKATKINRKLFIQPVQDIYLKSAIGNEISPNGSLTYLYIFGSIASFLLIIACINFMNLATARAAKRAKEVGVRKVVGANSKALVFQFLVESVLLSIVALFLSILFISLLLPSFNNLTQKNIGLFQKPTFIVWMAVISILTGFLSGIYPAIYLTSFKPIQVLKGKLINSISADFIRKGLVAFQFTISTALIVVTIIIWQQMDLLKRQDLGFKKEQKIILPFNNRETANNFEILKNETLKNPNVTSVCAGTSYPGVQLIEDQLFYAEGKTRKENVDIHFARITDDYVETMGYKLLYGRLFSKNKTADSNAIILNEKAINKLGYKPETAIGRKVYFEANNTVFTNEIIGIVKDFNYRSLHEPISPYGLLKILDQQPNFFIANIDKTEMAGVLADFSKNWKKVNPETPFEYSFLDVEFQKNYEKEEKTSTIIIYFTLIAILIACLGLYGLASFTAEQRTKEIGIRKVLGASVLNITKLLSKDFLVLVLIAFLIAFPFGYWIMNKWLQDFAFKIPINWKIFAISGIITITIVLLTVSYQAIKAALMNPVNSLKTE